VATGHTADDQAETVLHRIVRGTGTAGLAGIRPHRQLIPGVSLVRPLLNVSRREVLDYLAAIGQPSREDRSNADLRYTRNRIRHELLPDLAAKYNPGVVAAVTRLAALAGEVQDVIAGLVDDLSARCVTADRPGEVTVDCDVLASAPRFLVRELLIAIWRRQGWALQAMGFERWEELAELALAPQRALSVWKKVFPGSVAAAREGRVLRLLALPAEVPKSLS
jgi:tRNA(Ile)-lysidine synthase